MDRLTAHRTLSAVPAREITWIATHGIFHPLESGGVLTPKQGPVAGLHIVLSGHLSIHVDQGSGRRKVMEWRAGDVTGVMPYSRIVAPPGDVVAEEPSELVTITRANMAEMIRECRELTAILVHVMVDRARHFTSSFLHDEKLVSLGKLAAGLAHELNNPASAVARSASTLSESLMAADAAARNLGALGLNKEEFAVAENLRSACLSRCVPPILTPLQQEEREDSMTDWLASRGADTALAETLSNTDVRFDLLNSLAESINGRALNAALRWIAAGCTTRRLALEIHEAASRISDLVGAIKGFTEMDRATVPEPIDLERGLTSTLVVLRAKAKSKSVQLTFNIESDLP